MSKYTPDRVARAADLIEAVYPDERMAVDMLRAYAATLKAAQGGVTEAVIRRACRLLFPGLVSQVLSEREVRDAFQAALSAQPAERQGEAVAEIGPYWELRYVGNEPISKIVDRSGLKIGDKLYTHPAAPVGVPDGDAARFRFIVEHNWIGAKTRCAERIQDGDLKSARAAVDRAMLAAAPSAPQGEG